MHSKLVTKQPAVVFDEDVQAGEVKMLGSVPVVCASDQVAGKPVGIHVDGAFDFAKEENVIIEKGDHLFWYPTGNPVEGEAGSGCAGWLGSSGFVLGVALEDAAETDTHVRAYLMPQTTHGMYADL